jgi:hypothetical protein
MSKHLLVRAAVAFFFVGAAAPTALSQTLYRRSPDYDLPMFLARLPQFCYAQYFDTKQWHSPQYSIVAACGVGMNHFCPGLLNIMRAEYTINPKKFNRRAELRSAKENVDYTIARLKDPASCIYTQDIMAAKQRVNVLGKIIR